MKLFWTSLAVSIFGIAIVLPKAGGATPSPLPPMQTVLQRVMQTSEMENTNYHIFNQHYFYTRDKVTEYFDSDGDLKEWEEKQSTNDPNRALTLSKPYPPAPMAVSIKNQPPSETLPNVRGLTDAKKDDLLNPDLLKRFTFTLAGRDMLNGRSALVVDFKPVSDDLPVLNIKDRFLNSVAGRAWVDEGDSVLAKVDLHLTQRVSVLGGLVGAVSKFTYTIERDRTPDGFWFTRDVNWHLEGREATFQRLVDHHEEITDLQKLR